MNRLILLTNDDGYDASGLQALIGALEDLGDIFVVAPETEQSASSHSLTLRQRIRAEQIKDQHYKVSGTPTDSVLLGVHALTGRKPDLIVSGINHGPNMGEDVTYSGTVAAVIEGTILGVPSLAISSLQRRMNNTGEISKIARGVVEKALHIGMPEDCLLNVNIPDPDVASINGVKITRLGSRAYENILTREEDGDGSTHYVIGGEDPVWKDEIGTDISAVRLGFVSLTPLHLDLTHYKAVVDMERWRFDL